MYCVRKITDDLTWVGGDDRRLALFEGVYSVPKGVSYNSYLLRDEKTVLFDTVDKAVARRFLENVGAVLDGRTLDYVVLQHLEPDHTGALRDVLSLYPGAKIVCNKKTAGLLGQFFDFDADSRAVIVGENDALNTGRHELRFVMAPMVHWPEVMVTYDVTDKILFSADAFGCFGALNGALFADEEDFNRDYMDEARRYYANIVGKYGAQVRSLLEKALKLEIAMICPLHGFVWRGNFNDIISKYELWSVYQPEVYGVMLVYASVYGNTENAADLLAHRLRGNGIKTVMFDVSVTPASELVAAAFKWSHIVFASSTYNAGVFVTMEAFISDLCAHNIQNRVVAVIENGSWAPTAGELIAEKIGACKNIRLIESKITVRSSLKSEQLKEIETLADALTATLPRAETDIPRIPAAAVKDPSALDKLTYGLFIISAKDGDKENGCVTNTVVQTTASPLKISFALNKANLTHDMIKKTGVFNISVLTESAPFNLFERFGFQSGRDADKFVPDIHSARADNGVLYLTEHVNAVISGAVVNAVDCGTHTLFIAEVAQAFVLSGESSATYRYYFEHIKPLPLPREDKKSGFVCKICGYVHEGDELPEDFICPLCKHGAEDFERI
jgi:flavorubredoxin/flavin reductase (DIM6/NTAB) family NADH-FMN oxidoreductase RutF